MARVICDMSMSVDGYVTGPNDSRENPFGDGAEMLHDWIFDAATDEDRAVLQEMLDSVGAIVMGRTSFDKNEGDGGWGVEPAAGVGDRSDAVALSQVLPSLVDAVGHSVGRRCRGGQSCRSRRGRSPSAPATARRAPAAPRWSSPSRRTDGRRE
jgi:hypothetical protein